MPSIAKPASWLEPLYYMPTTLSDAVTHPCLILNSGLVTRVTKELQNTDDI